MESSQVDIWSEVQEVQMVKKVNEEILNSMQECNWKPMKSAEQLLRG